MHPEARGGAGADLALKDDDRSVIRGRGSRRGVLQPRLGCGERFGMERTLLRHDERVKLTRWVDQLDLGGDGVKGPGEDA